MLYCLKAQATTACDISARALYLLAIADCEGNFVVERVAAMAEGAVRWAQAQSEARQGPGLQAAVSHCMRTAVGQPHASARHRPSGEGQAGHWPTGCCEPLHAHCCGPTSCQCWAQAKW